MCMLVKYGPSSARTSFLQKLVGNSNPMEALNYYFTRSARRLLQSGNGRSVDKCTLKLRMLAKYSAGKGRSHIKLQCIRVAINQPVQKLVGVVAATVEPISLQQKSVLQSSPIAKTSRNNLSSSFRLGRQLQAAIY